MPVKLCVASDLHGFLPKEMPDCDLILLGGDYCPFFAFPDQIKWFDTVFREWLEKQKTRVIGIAGNHDRLFNFFPSDVPKGLKWTYLQDSSTNYYGLKIYGTPWQLPFGNGWGFNAPEVELKYRWGVIHEDTDILLCHGAPFDKGDKVVDYELDAKGKYLEVTRYTGSSSLIERIRQIKPKAVFWGHIHEGFGRYDEDGIIMANVSIMDENYKPTHQPTVIDVL